MAEILDFPIDKARKSGINCTASEVGSYDCSISEVCQSRGACFKRELKAELERERDGGEAIVSLPSTRF